MVTGSQISPAFPGSFSAGQARRFNRFCSFIPGIAHLLISSLPRAAHEQVCNRSLQGEIPARPARNGPHNHLANEKSPYLLQHADNPVDWYPWGDEAFARATAEQKPVFLSIGYSTCHWCHVMAHESFEDPFVASLLNESFICIKVDREERPDIDSVYMAVCQMMTGQGGWPLTIVMTPDKKPFFAATYIPKERRFSMNGLVDLLPRITSVWKNQREDLIRSAETITSALQPRNSGTDSSVPIASLPGEGFGELELQFDPQYGGFGTAPKFPSPHTLIFLLRVLGPDR